MGEVPRIHRVEPPPPIAGQFLRTAQTGDRPGGRQQPQGEEPEDRVELHEGSPESLGEQPPDPPEADDPGPIERRLDISL